MARSGKGRGSRPAREPRRTVAEAKVFMTGRSQAVRLPKEYRVSGDSVYVKRVGNTILLVPKTGDRWAGLFAALDEFPRDFTLERDQFQQPRAALENSGTAIGALDAFIAAQALSLGAVLVTSNEKEFQRVQGLQVENWG